jgi:hypothetical protein
LLKRFLRKGRLNLIGNILFRDYIFYRWVGSLTTICMLGFLRHIFMSFGSQTVNDVRRIDSIIHGCLTRQGVTSPAIDVHRRHRRKAWREQHQGEPDRHRSIT